MKAEPFTGRSAEMRTDSPWLAAEDIAGLGDIKVTIEAVYHYDEVTFEAGRKEKDVYAIAYRGKKKQHVLNATNRKTLVRRFGGDTTKWLGQEIKLYHDPNVRGKSGEIVGGIRIR